MYYLYLLIVISFSNMLNRTPDDFEYSGRIDRELVDEVRQLLPTISSFSLSLTGGDHSSSLALARLLQNSGKPVYIRKYCISACAEYILNSSANITVESDTIIALHGNPLVVEELYDIHKPVGYEVCDFTDAEEFSDFLTDNGRNRAISTIQTKVLSVENVDFAQKDDESCPMIRFSFAFDYWIPNSDQLEILFGRSFGKDLCADKPECIENYIGRAVREGKRVKIGTRAANIVGGSVRFIE